MDVSTVQDPYLCHTDCGSRGNLFRTLLELCCLDFVGSVLSHSDVDRPIARAAIRIDLAGQAHSKCIYAWNGLRQISNFDAFWTPGEKSKYTKWCISRGGLPLSLTPRGNETSYFPHVIGMCLPPPCSVSFVREYWFPVVIFKRMLERRAVRPSIRKLRRVLRDIRVIVAYEVKPENHVKYYMAGQAQRHLECINAWNSLQKDFSLAFWSIDNDADNKTTECKAHGGLPLVLTPRGNDTTYFPAEHGMCLPPLCSVSFLREYLLPYVVLENMQKTFSVRLNPLSLRMALHDVRVMIDRSVTLLEATPRLDFVIAGFPLSGTTTMGDALKRHPQVAMPVHEDQFFWRLGRKRSYMRSWGRLYDAAAAEKRTALQAVGSGAERILNGLKDPMIVFSLRTAQAVARVPAVKLIVMLRNPMDMMESWMRHACQWFDPYGNELTSGVALVHRALSSSVFMALPRDQMLLVPTAAMRLIPAVTLRRVLDFLELPTKDVGDNFIFPRSHSFEDSTSACTLPGVCPTICSAAGGALHRTLRGMLTTDAQLAGELLREEGWPRHTWDVMPSPCPGTGRLDVLSKSEEPTLCSLFRWPEEFEEFAPKCFEGVETCRDCCERFEAPGCSIYGERWSQCCDGLQRTLIARANSLARVAACPGNQPAGKYPCCGGRGRSKFWNTP